LTYHRICNKSNTTGTTSGPGLLTLQWYPSSTPIFQWVQVALSLVFCAVFSRSLFFLLAIVLSVRLRCVDFYDHFGIIKLFLLNKEKL